MELVPINGCVLVELSGELQHIEMPDKQYATNTSGVIIAVAAEESDYAFLVDKKVYFEGFKEVEVNKEDNRFAFVKIEDLRGYEQTEPES